MRVVFGRYLLSFHERPSKADWLRELKSVPEDHRIMIDGNEDDSKYHLVKVADGEQVYFIGIQHPDHGLTPSVLLLENDLAVFGFGLQVIGISCSAKRVVFQGDLSGLFYRFYPLPDNRFLILHELGVLVLSNDGDVVWGYDKDVVIQIDITPLIVTLKFMDAPDVVLDILTGRLKQ